MLSGSSTLVAVRRRARDGSNLPQVFASARQESTLSTPVLQMLLAQLASLDQRLNALATRPSSLQPTDRPDQDGDAERSEHVESSRLTKVFD